MDKKFIFIAAGGLLVVIVLIIVLVVVGSKKPNTDSTAKSNVLTIWDYKNEKEALDPFITSFQRDKKIKIEYVSKNPTEYYTDTVSAIAAGTGPDIWIVPNVYLPQFKDKLIPMPTNKIASPKDMKNDSEVFADMFPKVVNQDNILDGKIYGMPIAIDTLKLYINTDITNTVAEEYRLDNKNSSSDNIYKVRQLLTEGPKNWDDFVQAVRLITKKSGNTITQSGAALGTSNNISRDVDILTVLMLQNGAKMTSDDLSTAQFHTKQNTLFNVDYPGTKALEFYTSFSNPKSENYTWNSSMPDSIRAFAEGKTAMLIDYASAANIIKNINPKAIYQIAYLPQIKETTNPINYASYDSFVVTKSTKNANLAWDMILNITTSDIVTSYRSITKKTLAMNKYLDNEQVSTAVNWYDPNPDKVYQIFKNVITQVNEGNNAQTAMDGAAGQITTLLGKLKTQ